MGKIVGKFTDAIGITDSKAGERAASASRDSSEIQALYQQEALDFMKQQAKLPTEIRDQALTNLQSFYMGGDDSGFYDKITSDPMFQRQLVGMEDAALRNASATGGLRGGQSISDVSKLQDQLVMNRLGGIQQLAGLDTSTNQIAQIIGNIGQTKAQGLTAAAQAQAAGSQQNFGNLLGLGQLGIGAGMLFSDERLKSNIEPIGIGAGMLFSDERLKSNIEPIGIENGVPMFTWKWNDKAKELGLSGSGYGTLSKHAKEIKPESISVINGYEAVDYKMLGVSNG